MLRISLFISALLALCGCQDTWDGFDETESGWYRRLDALGDCELPVREADFVLLDFNLSHAVFPDSARHFVLYSGQLTDSASGGIQVQQFYRELLALHCGDRITLGMPVTDFNSLGIADSVDMEWSGEKGWIKLSVWVQRTFSDQSFREYLQAATQQEEITEDEAIQLALMNYKGESSEHGKVIIAHERMGEGDSISNGREVWIRYHTCLLNGTRLDSLTDMQFSFGRPGQLVPGLHYALSFLREGDSARIFMPSFLAFGEDGSSTGIVPRHTPVYFEVAVKEVISDMTVSGGN